jgi:two-component system, response regulator
MEMSHLATMSMENPSKTILMADDDPDDCLLTQDAWEEYGCPHTLKFVRDGEELLDYLHRRGKFSDTEDYPLPGMILLDLNMPRKNGHQALKEIRDHEVFRHIPVVVMTTSIDEEDTCRTYALGANACMTKPRSAQEFHTVVGALSQYWTSMVELPYGSEKPAWNSLYN